MTTKKSERVANILVKAAELLDGDDLVYGQMYHVTYLVNLHSIAERGLMPSGKGKFPGYGGHSKGRAFFTDWGGVRFWVKKLSDLAENESDNPIEDGLIPVVLTSDLSEMDAFKDPLGSRDSLHESVFVTDTIPAADLDYWDGFEWDRVVAADVDALTDAASSAAETRQEDEEGELVELVFPDFDVFLPKVEP